MIWWAMSLVTDTCSCVAVAIESVSPCNAPIFFDHLIRVARDFGRNILDRFNFLGDGLGEICSAVG